MKLKQLGSNMTSVRFPNGAEVLFSYETPVAGFTADGTPFRTTEHYSPTTSRHINKYLSYSVCWDGPVATTLTIDLGERIENWSAEKIRYLVMDNGSERGPDEMGKKNGS